MLTARRLGLVALIIVALGMPSTAKAQESAIIQATATVISSLAIIGTNNLVFGSITPGINKSVLRTSSGFAGEWSLTGTALAELSLTFTLPTYLIHSSGIGTMPISFTSSDAAYSNGAGSQSAPTGVINPLGPSTASIGAGGLMTVWIGGTVQPTISQSGGDYTSSITLTIAYTGN